MELNCRVCLQVEDLMVHIKEEVEDFNCNLITLLELCGGIKVTVDNTSPQHLCKHCTNELLVAAKFREKCKQTQKILNQIRAEFKASADHTSKPYVLVDQDDYSMPNNEKDRNVCKSTESGVEKDQTREIDCRIIASERDELTHLLPTGNDDEIEAFLTSNSMESATECIESDANQDYQTNENMNEMPFRVLNVDDDDYVTLNGSYSRNKIGLDNNDESFYAMELTSNAKIVNVKVSHDSDMVDEVLVINEKSFSYVCDLCGASFMHAFNLKRHFDKVHPVSEYFICKKCDYYFSSMPRYMEHCKTCGDKEIEEDSNVDLAQQSLPDIPTETPQTSKNSSSNEKECTYCGKKFTSVFALNMHLRVHTGERPFTCEICGKAFKTKSSLSTHLKRHSGQAEYDCSVCHKQFYETSNLINHMRIHTGEKPHACTVCHKRFARVYLLQLHMRTHTGEKPYQCSYCNKKFSQSSDLRYHTIAVHTHNWRYRCDICSKPFGKKKFLQAHLFKQHGAIGPVTENNISVDSNSQAYSGADEDNLVDDINVSIEQDLIVSELTIN